jgi:FkbH-like protein
MEVTTKKQKLKCLVWDLDNTLWDGILLEDADIHIPEKNIQIIKELDKRGILQSIASKNDPALAMKKLTEFNIEDYFIYPQINWNPKSGSVKKIAESINIGLDAVGFIDDQPFEREEVNYTHPEVLCIDAGKIDTLLAMPELVPDFITEDSKNRRRLYLNDIIRKKAEEDFGGQPVEFLATLGMSFSISPVQEGDLERVEELTVRTHQLNATGYTYSYEELKEFSQSDRYKLFIASLDDKYGSYGKIGLVLIECDEDIWTLKLLLMSCRVMSRGVGSVLLLYVLKLAREHKVSLQAEFVPTDRNRMMYITYKFAGFTEVEERDGLTILAHDLSEIQNYPEYITLSMTQFNKE